ncbi:MAG: glycosyltransferase family 4 protein [Cyanobacteria bacterium]|nr:glycosyltransferase family 4 protein [Cyanobacteria bacterium CG_2015-16_32_12]NCO78846.1 glycosyltransferase family 4 protein [Cyanobacteria bacterium CG_2015-22_32_23]NCQ42574.1 glycosyltransferase family 4 protein [Cyanobacteria bacterium CG_2015-04_32_10]
MKITFILPYADLSGGNRVISIYADRLQKLGHEVFVISQPKKKPNLKQQIKSLIKGKIKLFENKSEYSYFDDLSVTHKILETCRPVTDDDVPDGDVVIATWWETAEWVANLSQKKGAKAYFIQHHEIFDYLPKERVKATWKLPFHKITISQWLVDLAKTEYEDENVSLIFNSVDTQQFNAPVRTKQAIPTVGLLYSPVYWKGCALSFKALALARQEIPNLHLVAFGTTSPTKDLPLPENTTYWTNPLQDQIKNIYSQCDGWLFGSRAEGFGLPILEAMACRTPVIGTPAGAAPELLAKGGGILVKPENPEDMAKAIIKIAQMSNLEWRSMSDAAYSTATGYTWDDATQLFEQALYRAIERTKKREL